MDPVVVEKKKPALSWAEAAAEIVPAQLELALQKISKEGKTREPMGSQLLEFIDHLGIAFSAVSPPAQFPWLNMYKLMDVIDLPVSYLPLPVYQVSVEWIDQFPTSNLAGFVFWAFKYICKQMAGLPGPTRSHEALYVVLALVLRRKPIALTRILPLLILWKETDQELNKLPLTVWMMAQASLGDLCLGFFSWVHKLLPLLVGLKNPQSTDLILQLVEHILSRPEAQPILVQGAAARKGVARLIPPPSFGILLRLTFPDSSSRDEHTVRFEAIYPVLKEVALAAARRSELMKLVTEEIFSVSLELVGEGNHVLAKEATAIAIWSVTENIECCSHWDSLCKENYEAARVDLLDMLLAEWKYHSFKLSSPPHAPTLNQTIKSFMIKNKQSITQGAANEADNSCKMILGRLCNSRFTTAVITVVLAFAAALLFFNSGTATELKNLIYSLGLYQ